MTQLDFSSYIAERTREFTGRTWLFVALDRWLADPAAPRIFILAGEPGIGKSAIAGRLLQFSDGAAEPPAGCARLGRGFVSAVHICSARNGGWIAPESFVRSVSAQMAARYPVFAQGIQFDPRIRIEQRAESVTGTMIGAQIANYYAESPEALFDSLVRQPLRALCESEDAPGQIVLLVDGLDESLQFTGRTTIVRLLAMCHDLPEQVRLLLTTRPVDTVLEPFRPLRPFVLHADSAENQDDVRAYARARLRGMGAPQVDEAVERLAARGRGNFLVVSKVLGAVARGELGLDDSRAWPTDLHELYAWFLERLTRGDREAWRERYRPVLGLLAVAREAVDAALLACWSGQDEEAVRDALHDLRELLDPGQTVRHWLYHESVADFLTQETASNYYLDPQRYHHQIAEGYLARYGAGRTPWAECDSYGLRHLPTHLAAVGEHERLQALLLDFDWLQAKLEATDVNTLIGDDELAGDDRALRLVRGALRLSAHVLAQDKSQLAGQLLGRLLSFDEAAIKALLAQAQQWRGAVWLRPLTSSLIRPGGALARTLVGHAGAVWSVAVSPDGQYILSASQDNLVKVWDVTNGTCVRTLRGHRGAVHAVAVVGDEQLVVTASDDQTLKLWDLATGAEIRTLAVPTNGVCAVATTPDGLRAISASNNHTLKVWDLTAGSEVFTLSGHMRQVTAIALVHDGRRCLSASLDGTLKLWDLIGGGEVCTLRVNRQRQLNAVAVTLDGRYAVSSSGTELQVWDLASRDLVHDLNVEDSAVRAIGITPNGQHAISVSDSSGSLCVWDLARGSKIYSLKGYHVPAFTVAVTPDGRRAISGLGDGQIQIWELALGTEVTRSEAHQNVVTAVAVTPDGRRALSVSYDGTVRLWNPWDGGEKRTIISHPGRVRGGESAVAVLPNGYQAITGSWDGLLKLWDLDQGRELRTGLRHRTWVTAAAVTPDGNRVVSASTGRFGPYGPSTIRVQDLRSGRDTTEIDSCAGPVTMIRVTPDGRRAVCAEGGTWGSSAITVWDLFTGEVRKLCGHDRSVNAVAVTPDARQVISGSSDTTIKIWDIFNGSVVCTLEGHQDWVRGIAVSADMRWLASASSDHTLRLWNLVELSCVATITADGQIVACEIAMPPIPGSAPVVIAGDSMGAVHFLRLEGAVSGAPIVTPWCGALSSFRSRVPHDAHALAVGCPHCQAWSSVAETALGGEWQCSRCGAALCLNPFTIDADWRPIAMAWRRGKSKVIQ